MLRYSVCFLLIVFVLRATLLHGADQHARLDLRVNGNKKGQITVIIRGSDILAQLADLENAGTVIPAGYRETIRGAIYVSLQSLMPLVSFTINETDLSLRLTTKPEAFASAPNDPSIRGILPSQHREIGVASVPSPVKDLRAMLGFKVNDGRKASIAVILRGDDILAPLKDLGELPSAPSGRQEIIRGERFISLKSLSPSVTYQLDEKALELGLTVNPTVTAPSIAEVQPDRPLESVQRQEKAGASDQGPADQ